MGSNVLRGITTALLVTVLTLFAGIIWGTMGLGGLSISQLVDIGLLASCLIGGYRTAKESREWFLGGVTGAGYVVVGTLLLALFLPIRGLGFIQVLVEGTLLGLVAGAFGAGHKGIVAKTWPKRRYQSNFMPAHVGNDKDDLVGSNFNWDAKEEYTPSKFNWIEKPEDEFHEIQDIRSDSVQNQVVEWPWDRETKKTAAWESKQVPNDLVVWDKVEEKAKPWWDE